MINLDFVTPTVILAGLVGAVLWGMITWWLKLPTSSSHALLGGYAGAAMGYAVLQHGWVMAWSPIIVMGWIKTLSFIVIAPFIGLTLGFGFMKLSLYIQVKLAPHKFDKTFRRLQLASSAFLSVMHGGNDAQKTAGIITGVLMASGALKEFEVPYWVLCASYAMMGFGTLCGGWRIVHTMGHRLTKLNPNGGFCAETAGAFSIMIATTLQLPVSTTHAVTGSILGVGSARNVDAVRWGVARHIAWAWILTMPCAGVMGATALVLLNILLK